MVKVNNTANPSKLDSDWSKMKIKTNSGDKTLTNNIWNLPKGQPIKKDVGSGVSVTELCIGPTWDKGSAPGDFILYGSNSGISGPWTEINCFSKSVANYNSAGFNCFNVDAVALNSKFLSQIHLEKLSSEKLTIYPNPLQENGLHVLSKEVILSDIQGRTIHKKSVNDTYASLAKNFFPVNEMIFVTVITSKNTVTKKIMSK